MRIIAKFSKLLSRLIDPSQSDFQPVLNESIVWKAWHRSPSCCDIIKFMCSLWLKPENLPSFWSEVSNHDVWLRNKMCAWKWSAVVHVKSIPVPSQSLISHVLILNNLDKKDRVICDNLGTLYYMDLLSSSNAFSARSYLQWDFISSKIDLQKDNFSL